MEKNFNELQVGRRYENRKGEVKKIVYNNGHNIYSYVDEQKQCYTLEGRVIHRETSEYDLVKLLPEEPTDRLAELEAKRAQLDKEIEALKKNTQTVYCVAYIRGTPQEYVGVCACESDKQRQKIIDTWGQGDSPTIALFDLPFRKVNDKWEPAFKISKTQDFNERIKRMMKEHVEEFLKSIENFPDKPLDADGLFTDWEKPKLK